MSSQRSVNRSAVVIAAAITLLTIATVANNRAVASPEIESANSRPYTMQYSNMISAADFSLGEGETYYSKLAHDEENILLFWGSFCPHCENIFDYIEQSDAEQTIKRNLFTVSEDGTLAGTETHKGEFPILIDIGWRTFDKFKLEHLPSALVVDGEGRILGSAEGEHDVKELLDEYVQRNK